MFTKQKGARQGTIPVALSLCALTLVMPALAAPAFGQSAGNPATAPKGSAGGASKGAADTHAKKAKKAALKVSDKKAISPNAVVNLVNILVQKGVIKENQGQVIIKEVEDETYVQRQAAKDASVEAQKAAKIAAAADAAANPPGTKHVTYVPEFVKRQMREEIKRDVMAQALREGWASPGKYPEWASRIHFYGDFRARYEGAFFPGGNDPASAVNFNGINTGAPYDASVSNNYFPSLYDVNQNRNEFELMARLGMQVDIVDGLTVDMRMATGNSPSPISTNQTLGYPGNFSLYELWLDRANMRYQHSFGPTDLRLSLGRFDNPFFAATDLMWYKDLGFDGIALQAQYAVSSRFQPFGTLGAFPIFNSNFNAGIALADPTTGEPVDLPSHDKYLFGGQIGFNYNIAPNYYTRVGLAYYDFDNVQGEMSSPCTVATASDVCDTDMDRPSYAQKGNTYMPLRNIIPDSNNGYGTQYQYQYYGLASAFRPLVVDGRLDMTHFNPVHITLDGEFIWNTAFNRAYIQSVAVNNFAGTPDGSLGPFNGGNLGWQTRVTVGDPVIRHLWDWNVNVGYKYLQSDATIDAFTDPDFGLGGTNLKGYYLGGNLGLADNVWMTLRWMSANNISGSPYAVDVLQLDLNSRF